MTQNLLTDGFAILQRMPTAEIERRIEWLENALASYRQILVVKQLMDRRPELQTPPEWESAIPREEEPLPVRRRVRGGRWGGPTIPDRMKTLLIQFPDGLDVNTIADRLNCSTAAVYSAAKDPGFSRDGGKFLYAEDRHELTEQEQRDLAEEDLKEREKYAV